MIIIGERFNTCIAFMSRQAYCKADVEKLFVPTSLGWTGYLKYERFTKSGNVILSSEFKLDLPKYMISMNQKRGNRYHHTVYPSMVLAVEYDS